MSKVKITTFGEYIRELRSDLGFSLKDVAQRLNIDPSLLGKIERNGRYPTRTQIRKLAKIFELKEEDLVSIHLSDQIAYKILQEECDTGILKLAEKKVKYYKLKSKIETI